MKGFINHNIKFNGKTVEFNLLRYSVLSCLSNQVDHKKTCKYMQSMYRKQLSLAMAAGRNKLEMTYAANCPPCGYKINVRTRLCQNAKICPFCFVRRRLSPAYKALEKIPEIVRQDSKIIAWHRTLPYGQTSLTCFSKNYGPHQMLGAYCTVQALLPYVDDANNLQIKHIGVQLVRRDCAHDYLLRKLYLTFHVEETANSLGIYKAIVFATRLPWKNLFNKMNTDKFMRVMDDFNKRRLIRINKYKGESNGN